LILKLSNRHNGSRTIPFERNITFWIM